MMAGTFSSRMIRFPSSLILPVQSLFLNYQQAGYDLATLNWPHPGAEPVILFQGYESGNEDALATRRSKVELCEQIRREYEHGVVTIRTVARKLGVHRQEAHQIAQRIDQCQNLGR